MTILRVQREGRSRGLFLAAGLLAGAIAGSDAANAQSAFCPPNPGVPLGNGASTFALSSGRCTNGNTGSGAFSGAALGSQSLSDLASGSTETTNRAAAGMVDERRRRAQFGQPIPRVQSRSDSQLPSRTRVPESVRARSEAAPARRRTETRLVKRGNRMVRVRVAAPIVLETPVVPLFVQAALQPSIGVFAQGFGDYEQRSGRGTSSLLYVLPDPFTGVVGTFPPEVNQLRILTKSNSTTYGALAGIDYTTRGIFGPNDGLVVGALGGYVENDVKISSQILSGDLSLANHGSSSLRARASGASVGGFASYFNGPFSIDGMYKADFLDLNQSFVDNQAFSATSAYNFTTFVPDRNAPQNAVITGTGKTSLVNHSLVGNINLRIPLAGTLWVEPTVGVQARWVDYASSSTNLGLANGHLFRVQGGARLGWDYEYAGMKITPILTGLAYSDVTVRGGFVDYSPTGAFGAATSNLGIAGSSTINIRQEGRVRGQGILTVVGDFGNGWSGFVQGDVRGGKDLFGYGGKGGLRYSW